VLLTLLFKVRVTRDRVCSYEQDLERTALANHNTCQDQAVYLQIPLSIQKPEHLKTREMFLHCDIESEAAKATVEIM